MNFFPPRYTSCSSEIEAVSPPRRPTFCPANPFIRSEPEIGPRANEIIFESVVILDIGYCKKDIFNERRGGTRKKERKLRKLVTRSTEALLAPCRRGSEKRKRERGGKKFVFRQISVVDVAKFFKKRKKRIADARTSLPSAPMLIK